MPWRIPTIAHDVARLMADIARLEGKVDAAISQAAADRSTTQAHIAECNLRNRHADEEEDNAKREWELFKANVFQEISKLSEKVGKTQLRVSLLVAAVGGAAWVADHFHLLAMH